MNQFENKIFNLTEHLPVEVIKLLDKKNIKKLLDPKLIYRLNKLKIKYTVILFRKNELKFLGLIV